MISAFRGFTPDTPSIHASKCLTTTNKAGGIEAGYDALWLDNQGYVAEAAASNVFLVKRSTTLHKPEYYEELQGNSH